MASYDGGGDGHRGRPPPQQHRPSSGGGGGGGSGDLASSAKLVAEAAKSVFQDHNLEKVDKGRVAGAAAELLHAASQYGKLDGKPAGNYLEKAEEYLHQYGRKEGSAGSGGGGGGGASTGCTAGLLANISPEFGRGVGGWARASLGFVLVLVGALEVEECEQPQQAAKRVRLVRACDRGRGPRGRESVFFFSFSFPFLFYFIALLLAGQKAER
jgi:hypothetical protein